MAVGIVRLSEVEVDNDGIELEIDVDRTTEVSVPDAVLELKISGK